MIEWPQTFSVSEVSFKLRTAQVNSAGSDTKCDRSGGLPDFWYSKSGWRVTHGGEGIKA